MSTTHPRGKKRTAIILAAILTVSGGAAAFAFWTADGSGTGTATTGTSMSFTVTSEHDDGLLAPGSSPGQVVTVTVANPGTGAKPLTKVTVLLGTVVKASGAAAGECLPGNYAVTFSPPPYGEMIAPGGSVPGGKATVTMVETGLNQDACQGATVNLAFTAS
jgi:hypothetical protein